MHRSHRLSDIYTVSSQYPRGVRGEAEGADHGDESGDCGGTAAESERNAPAAGVREG